MTTMKLRAELLREMSPLLDSETAMKKLLSYVRTLLPAKEEKSDKTAGWADSFVGVWKDERSADEIMDDIYKARTANHFEG